MLREAHMTQFTKMFALSGLAMATVIGLSWVVASPAPTNASTYVAAQIDPDQMTRNATSRAAVIRPNISETPGGARRPPPLMGRS